MAQNYYQKLQREVAKNEKIAYIESRNKQVDSYNGNITAILNEFDSILKNRDFTTFNINKIKKYYIEPAFTIPKELNYYPTKPEYKNFEPKPLSFFISIFPKSFFQKKRQAHKELIIKSEQLFEKALQQHEVLLKERAEKIEIARKKHLAKCESDRLLINNKNNDLDELVKQYSLGNIDAGIAYIKLGLENLSLPKDCKGLFEVKYNTETKELYIEYTLPYEKIIPETESYSYIKTRDEIKPKPRKDKEIKELYQNLIYSISIRVIYEFYKLDYINLFDIVKFTGLGATKLNNGLVIINTTRKEFEKTNFIYINSFIQNNYIKNSKKNTNVNIDTAPINAKNDDLTIVDVTNKNEKISYPTFEINISNNITNNTQKNNNIENIRVYDCNVGDLIFKDNNTYIIAKKLPKNNLGQIPITLVSKTECLIAQSNFLCQRVFKNLAILQNNTLVINNEYINYIGNVITNNIYYDSAICLIKRANEERSKYIANTSIASQIKTVNNETKIAPQKKKIKISLQSIKDVKKLHSETVKILEQVLTDDDETKIVIPSKTKNNNAQVPNKIRINLDLANEVSQKHTKTIEILSDVLSDENDVQKQTIVLDNSIFLSPNIVMKENTLSNSGYIETLILNNNHLDLLSIFKDRNFKISNEEIDTFAKSRSVFKSRLIDSINESCYEHLDDNLIEETETGYEINTLYYNKILQNG